jgi:hypothetical protein
VREARDWLGVAAPNVARKGDGESDVLRPIRLTKKPGPTRWPRRLGELLQGSWYGPVSSAHKKRMGT